MGTLYKRQGSRNWMMAVSAGRKQVCKSSHTHNKRLASKLLARWETEVFEGRFHLSRSAPPLFEKWADEFLSKIVHPNTKKRYSSSVRKLKKAFKGMQLPAISPERIEEFGDSRLAEGVEAATVNHDLRALRRMLRLAERKQFIAQNPFSRLEFLKERPARSQRKA